MSFQKFKTNNYCVGGKHRSGTKNVAGEISFNEKTGKEIKLLVGKCEVCNKKNQWLFLIILFKHKVLEISSKNWGMFLVKQLKIGN